MKKQRVAEALYIIVAIAFIGIFFVSKNPGTEEAFGTNVSEEPAQVTQVGTNVSEAPDETPTQASGQASDAALTSAPVQDTIPAVTFIPDATPNPIPEQLETEVERTPGIMPGAIEIKNENYEQYSNEQVSWWFRRNEKHEPSGSGESFPIEEYSAYYLDKSATDADKVFYVTFDCGYENGFTPTILDTLAEKNVKAMFFVTKEFIVKNPEYVVRMKEEGHLVGNHTVRHLSSPTLTSEELAAELYEVALTMEQETGYSIDPLFRAPMGKYSERVLKVVEDMGYTSVFWSIAYYDYDVNDQPGKDYVVDHFTTYHHNGCIALIHNTSESNAQALGDVLDLLRDAGYRFGALTEL